MRAGTGHDMRWHTRLIRFCGIMICSAALCCGRADDEKNFLAAVAAAYPAPARQFEAAPDSINRALAYHALYNSLNALNGGELSRQVLKRLERIAGRRYLGYITEEIKVVDFSWKKSGNDTIVLRLLFEVSKPLPEGYSVFIYGKYDRKHEAQLTQRFRGRKVLDWKLNVAEPSQNWHQRRFLLIEHECRAPDVPLHLSVGIFKLDVKWNPIGRFVPLGWHYDL